MKLIIAGAGPIGLCFAIKLKEAGVKEVLLLDPRVGDYTRPGVLDESVFDTLSQSISFSIKSSGSRHIKDAERGLHKVALTLGVTIKPYQFEGFRGNNILVKDKKGKIISIPCELLFESTGSKRAVINEVNKTVSPAPFNLEEITDNPLKIHFIAYVSMDPKHTKKLQTPLAEAKKDSLRYVLLLEKLRELGWEFFAEPTFNYQILSKNKVCLYCEIPDTLKPEHREEWIKTLLQLHSGSDEIYFEQLKKDPDKEKKQDSIKRKAKKKPRFVPFPVNPQKVSPLSYAGKAGMPLVIPIGDAQIEPDYRLGLGIKSGIERMDALFKSLNIKEGEVVEINLKKYEELVQLPMIRHERELQALGQDRKEKLKNLKEISELYQAALKKCATQDIEKISNSLDKIEKEIAMSLYHEAWQDFQKSLNKQDRIQLDTYGNVQSELLLKRTYNDLIKAFNVIPQSYPEEKTKIVNALISTAKYYQELAKVLFALRKFEDGENYFQKALNLYNLFPHQYEEECIKLLSNLVILASKRKDFSEAVNKANQALQILPRVEMKDKELMAAKLEYNRTSALLEQVVLALDTATLSDKRKLALMTELEECIDQLNKHPTVKADERKKLVDRFIEIKTSREDLAPRKKM